MEPVIRLKSNLSNVPIIRSKSKDHNIKKKKKYKINKIFTLSNINSSLYTGIAPGKKDTKWNLSTEKDYDFIKKNNIDIVICLLEEKEMDLLQVGDYKKYANERNIVYYNLPVKDEKIPSKEMYINYYKGVIDSVENLKKGKNILVHCRCGMGRSSTFALLCCYALYAPIDISQKCIQRITSLEQQSFICPYVETVQNRYIKSL